MARCGNVCGIYCTSHFKPQVDCGNYKGKIQCDACDTDGTGNSDFTVHGMFYDKRGAAVKSPVYIYQSERCGSYGKAHAYDLRVLGICFYVTASGNPLDYMAVMALFVWIGYYGSRCINQFTRKGIKER